MARTSTAAVAVEAPDPDALFSDWLVQAQRMQADALASWQQALSGQWSFVSSWFELQAELSKPVNSIWDGWMAQWTGGVPIDG
ncbi:hypothetical protein [Piscinibacter sp. XHJ-5]|uniref:hypothetical protein n=1 Tax=Piscinibacter sp. XHJ-5 TaxID=3037797 RepID=UPI002452FC33|nr:hypothetical protein [Piscinibacter sp. XHJ-5]